MSANRPGSPFTVPIDYEEGAPRARWTVGYAELAREFQTGDLVLQHGTHDVSIAISVLQSSYFSHIGMVAKPEDLGIEGVPDGAWLYLESNTLTDLKDWISGDEKEGGGPMAVLLEERLRKNLDEGKDLGMVWRKLRFPWTDETLAALRAYVDSVKKKEFRDDPMCGMTVLMTWIAGRVRNDPNETRYMFCSELLAGCYQTAGLLPARWVPNAYSPKDFSRTGHVALLSGAALGPEIWIDPDSLK